jgi:hypothetical protein
MYLLCDFVLDLSLQGHLEPKILGKKRKEIRKRFAK